MELVKVQSSYVSKKTGDKVKTWNYFLVYDDGKYLAIKPCFKEDFKLIFWIAKTNEKKDND